MAGIRQRMGNKPAFIELPRYFERLLDGKAIADIRVCLKRSHVKKRRGRLHPSTGFNLCDLRRMERFQASVDFFRLPPAFQGYGKREAPEQAVFLKGYTAFVEAGGNEFAVFPVTPAYHRQYRYLQPSERTARQSGSQAEGMTRVNAY